ncbi:MAG: signal peptidase II [Methylococcales bacterium]
MKLVKRLIIIILVSLICFGCDQGTKSLASSYLPKNEMISYYSDTVRIGYIENKGAFLGLGSSLPEYIRFLLFTVLSGLFLIGLLIYLIYGSSLNLITVIGFSLLLSGGGSNLYDRIVNDGVVIDFLNIGIGMVRTGIFNVADMAIILGGLLFFVTHLKYSSRE